MITTVNSPIIATATYVVELEVKTLVKVTIKGANLLRDQILKENEIVGALTEYGLEEFICDVNEPLKHELINSKITKN